MCHAIIILGVQYAKCFHTFWLILSTVPSFYSVQIEQTVPLVLITPLTFIWHYKFRIIHDLFTTLGAAPSSNAFCLLLLWKSLLLSVCWHKWSISPMHCVIITHRQKAWNDGVAPSDTDDSNMGLEWSEVYFFEYCIQNSHTFLVYSEDKDLWPKLFSCRKHIVCALHIYPFFGREAGSRHLKRYQALATKCLPKSTVWSLGPLAQKFPAVNT